MKIKLEKLSKGWRADCLDLPGSPPCGDGKTKDMAIAALFYSLIKEGTWTKYLKLNEPLWINERIYSSPWKNSR